jgi:hypothetical protein
MKQLYLGEEFIIPFDVTIELHLRQALPFYNIYNNKNVASGQNPPATSPSNDDLQYVDENAYEVYKRKRSKDLLTEPRIDPYHCFETAKRSYPSEKSAKKHLRKIQTSQGSNHHRIPIAFYQCEFCSKWHLTSKERKKLAA